MPKKVASLKPKTVKPRKSKSSNTLLNICSNTNPCKYTLSTLTDPLPINDRCNSNIDRYNFNFDRYNSISDRYNSNSDRYNTNIDRYFSNNDRYFSNDNTSEEEDGLLKPVQRNAANARERARMRILSKAFFRLKTTLPWVSTYWKDVENKYC